MIYHNPPLTVLAAAELIMLTDPGIPGWKEVVVRRAPGLATNPGTLAVIHIPVDSTDAAGLQVWRDRIAAARA